MNKYYLKCTKCGQQYREEPNLTVCPECHGDINFPSILDIIYDYDYIKDTLELPDFFDPCGGLESGVWAYDALLPSVPQSNQIDLGEGYTPIITSQNLRTHYELDNLFLKNEALNPTGSYKDRLAAVMVGKAQQFGVEAISLVSSGNMAAAVAGYATAADLRTYVILPPSTPEEKIHQIRLSGAEVVRVEGTGADRLQLNEEIVQSLGWYNGNSPFNPYGSEGAKTAAFEEVQYFGKEKLPDWIVLPVGFGDNLVGHWKGFRDLVNLGLLEDFPSFAGIQAEGSPSFVRAFKEGKQEAIPSEQDTIAGGISQKVTLNSYLGLKALRETNGVALTVTDEDILRAEITLARKTGLFIEPTGVVGLAGVKKMREEGIISKKDSTLVLLTGSGFKDLDSAKRLAGEDIGEPIEPKLEVFKERVR